MSLLDGNYIESAHSFDTAWELVLQALVGSSQPGFDWQVDADKTAKRVVATMDFGNAFEVKRHLTLQLAFSQIGEALRLEMHYEIIPMVNIGQSEKLLQKARDSIGKALTAGQELYQVGIIPANKEVQAQAERERQGNDRLLQGIEVALLLNLVLVVIFSITTKSLQSAMSIVLLLQVSWIPIGFFFAMFASPKNGGGKLGPWQIDTDHYRWSCCLHCWLPNYFIWIVHRRSAREFCAKIVR